SLDVYQPARPATSPRPILLYIHGGGWAIGDKKRVEHKAQWATDQNMVFVSVNYRLSPRVMHPQHATDVAQSIAYVIDHASEWNADPDQLIVMGHSAGAHLAAIVATDESLLDPHDRAPSDLAAVILLDGAGYNIEQRFNDPDLSRLEHRWYTDAFGSNPKSWELASPTLQIHPSDPLPALLAVYAGDVQSSRLQTIELANAWKATNAPTTIHHAPTKDHTSINKDLGKQNDPDTQVVQEFIELILSTD
ncbi:MAG: alpha/beta hydrolase, partial [Phycisphaerales bacterium]